MTARPLVSLRQPYRLVVILTRGSPARYWPKGQYGSTRELANKS